MGLEVTQPQDVFTATDDGLAPASGVASGKFLRDDGTWAAPGASGFDFWSDAPVGVVTMYEGSLSAHANLPGGASPKWSIIGKDMVVLGADDALLNDGTEGGTESLGSEAAHAGSAVANHAVTQPSAHANHGVTQPSGHSNHIVTQPANHAVTQPSAHAALATHAHELPFQKVAGGTGVLRMLAASIFGTGTSRAAESVSAAPVANTTAAAVELSQAVTGGTPSAHAGTAVNAHSATAVDAHSAHAGAAVDAHSAHAGAAVDAHGVTQPNTHAIKKFHRSYVLKKTVV